jgi:hypothetical protein
MATSSSGSPNNGRGAGSGYFHWHLDAYLLSIALERVTIERFMLARVVAAAVVLQSARTSRAYCRRRRPGRPGATGW